MQRLDSFLESRKTLFGFILLLPATIVFAMVSIFPILFGIWISFYSGMRLDQLTFVGLDNYLFLLEDPHFWGSVWTGAIYAVYSVFVQMVVGIGIALMINKSFKFANTIRAIILLPYMIPTVAVALVFAWIGNPQYGILNYLFIEAGIIQERINPLGTDMAMHGVVWIGSWKFTLFVVLIILARLQSIDQTLYEAAKVNGANTLRQFFDVTLPQIKTAIYLVLLLRGIWMFNKFDVIWLLTRGGPFRETETMVIYAYRRGILSLLTGIGAAITVVMFVMLLVMSIIYFKIFKPSEEVEVT